MLGKKIALEYYLFRLKNQWKRQTLHDELDSFNHHIKRVLSLKEICTLRYHYTANQPLGLSLKKYLNNFG